MIDSIRGENCEGAIGTKSATQLVYLDGQAFGQLDGKRADGTTMTSLVLPSGAGVRASDFESWFFLVPNAPLQFTINPTVPTTLRAEGLTELVSDIVLTGTGGTPTAAELQSSNDLFLPLLARPSAQSRRAKIRDIGYGIPSDFELNFGRYLPSFGQADDDQPVKKAG